MPKFRKPFNSLQFQLIFWSVVSLLLLAIVAGGYGFWYSYNEINDFQDDNLKNTAALLEQSLNISGLNNNAAYSYSDEHARSNIHFDTDDDDGAITVDIVILSASLNNGVEDYQNVQSDDEHDYSEPIPLALVNSVPQGISDQNIDGHSWRTYRNDVKIESLDTDEEVALILRQQTDLQDDLRPSRILCNCRLD
ncbi:hypothetical protein [Psychrobacter celer]|uniref:hypothetical protein n=1 Tax=Psychrobacter celer TaxID=306572 RepID=UPI003FD245A4